MKILLLVFLIILKYNLHSSELIDIIGHTKYYKTKSDETFKPYGITENDI